MEIKKIIKLNSSIAILNQKLNNIHFNYTGKEFRIIHKLTENLYKKGLELYDDLSEKIVMRDFVVPASYKEHIELSIIKEEVSRNFDDKNEISKILVKDLSKLLELTNSIEAIGEVQPLLDEILLVFDKYKWFFKRL